MRILLLLLCLQTAAAAASPRVVTSIAPLQEITEALMDGVGKPQTIIGAQGSVHHFAFRPSHMRMLQQADLVIWIDRHFEASFLQVAQILPSATVQLELMPELGIASDDGHIWYSAPRLQQVIDAITARLVRLDPANAARYRDNAARLSAAVAAWRADSEARLKNRQPRFVTDHVFSTHLQADQGFAPIASIHDQHDDHGGLRELGRIEQSLRQQPARCLLTLESPPAPLAAELAQKYRLEIIDLGAITGADDGTPAIIRRLQRLSSALLHCSNPGDE